MSTKFAPGEAARRCNRCRRVAIARDGDTCGVPSCGGLFKDAPFAAKPATLAAAKDEIDFLRTRINTIEQRLHAIQATAIMVFPVQDSLDPASVDEEFIRRGVVETKASAIRSLRLMCQGCSTRQLNVQFTPAALYLCPACSNKTGNG